MGAKYRIINYNKNASEFYLPGRSNPVKIYPGEANAVNFEGLTKKEILSLRGLAKVGLILRPVIEKKIEKPVKQVVDLEMDTTGEVTKEDILVTLGQKDDTPQDDTPQDDTPQDDTPQDDTPQSEDEGTDKGEQPAEDTEVVDTKAETEESEESTVEEIQEQVVEDKTPEVEDKKALRDELVGGRDLKSIPADELKVIFNKLGLSVEGSLTKGKAIGAIEGV